MDNATYSLSPRDRIEHYRNLTAEAVERAHATNNPKLKAVYVDRALRWLAHLEHAQHAVETLTAVSAESGDAAPMADEDAE